MCHIMSCVTLCHVSHYVMMLWFHCRCDTAADDIKNITSKDQVEKLANQIEEALYSLHNDITTKYKTKYRSLLFNLRDPKNQVSNNT